MRPPRGPGTPRRSCQNAQEGPSENSRRIPKRAAKHNMYFLAVFLGLPHSRFLGPLKAPDGQTGPQDGSNTSRKTLGRPPSQPENAPRGLKMLPPRAPEASRTPPRRVPEEASPRLHFQPITHVWAPGSLPHWSRRRSHDARGDSKDTSRQASTIPDWPPKRIPDISQSGIAPTMLECWHGD